MKYTAHLSTGGTVDVEIDGDENLFGRGFGEPNDRRNAGWLVGNNGEMVNLDYCAALIPVLAEKPTKPAQPNTFVDNEGDWWRLQEDGEYRLYTGNDGYFPCGLRETYEEIQKTWGIDHVVD